MHPGLWIPVVALLYAGNAYLSAKNNGAGARAFLVLWAYTTLTPAWEIISRYSKNLVIDGLLFDVTVSVSWTTTAFLLTRGRPGLQHLAGLFFVVVGMVLLKR